MTSHNPYGEIRNLREAQIYFGGVAHFRGRIRFCLLRDIPAAERAEAMLLLADEIHAMRQADVRGLREQAETLLKSDTKR